MTRLVVLDEFVASVEDASSAVAVQVDVAEPTAEVRFCHAFA